MQRACELLKRVDNLQCVHRLVHITLAHAGTQIKDRKAERITSQTRQQPQGTNLNVIERNDLAERLGPTLATRTTLFLPRLPNTAWIAVLGNSRLTPAITMIRVKQLVSV